jgi:SAM-dependent methyltransferase
LRNHQIARLYTNDILGEYESIKTSLPPQAERILDIGCGMAGIDVRLFEHYDRRPYLYLMDKARLDLIYYGYKAKAAFYNDIQTARRLLNQNGVPDTHIRFVEAEATGIDQANTDFDLVISTIAWGFHFPLSTYLDEVLRSLRPGGRIIVDIRKGGDGLRLLGERNLGVSVIVEHAKYQRVCITT